MEFLYLDCNGRPMGRTELEALNLWNPVMEQVLSEAIMASAGENVPFVPGNEL